MQGLTLNCNCCESRREHNFKPLSYLDSGPGRGDKGIPKESALSAQFPLDSAVLLPLPSPHSSSPTPIFSTASLCCHRKKPDGCYEDLFTHTHTLTHTHTHTLWHGPDCEGDEWQFFLGCVFLSLNLLLPHHLFCSPHVFMLLLPARR